MPGGSARPVPIWSPSIWKRTPGKTFWKPSAKFTPWDRKLEPFLDQVELILVMTGEPGCGGQKFMAHMMPKLSALRDRLAQVNPSCLLEVDGGIDAVTAPIVKENGAGVLVSGSAYFRSTDKPAFIAELAG